MDRIRLFRNNEGHIIYVQGIESDCIYKDVISKIKNIDMKKLNDYYLIYDNYDVFKQEYDIDNIRNLNGYLTSYIKNTVKSDITLADIIKLENKHL